jgi:hypothetical protein
LNAGQIVLRDLQTKTQAQLPSDGALEELHHRIGRP